LRVPDPISNVVAFVATILHVDPEGKPDFDYVGTGFVISVPVPFGNGRDIGFFHFVTAAHVVKKLHGETIAFLVNEKGGGTKMLRPVGSTFYGHPTDEAADVAAIQFQPETDMDITHIPIKELITKEKIDKFGIGIGDEVFAVGLFSFAPGEARNMPIVRHGNIAMLPDQKIQTDMGFADVYLIEARSIGGLSGSPVFVRRTLFFSGKGAHPPTTISTKEFQLLGSLMDTGTLRNQISIILAFCIIHYTA
jgi:hypothetical protein